MREGFGAIGGNKDAKEACYSMKMLRLESMIFSIASPPRATVSNSLLATPLQEGHRDQNHALHRTVEIVADDVGQIEDVADGFK